MQVWAGAAPHFLAAHVILPVVDEAAVAAAVMMASEPAPVAAALGLATELVVVPAVGLAAGWIVLTLQHHSAGVQLAVMMMNHNPFLLICW